MVQDQLIDYIASQIKNGTSSDAIRTTLLGVGWPTADVDDSFNKMDSAAAAAATVAARVAPATPAASPVSTRPFASPTGTTSMPAASAATRPVVSSPAISKPVTTPTDSGSQVLRMSDLVSSTAGPMSKTTLQASDSAVAAMTKNAKMTATSFEAAPQGGGFGAAVGAFAGGGKKTMIVYGVLGALVLIFGGGAAYLFMQNNSLSSQVGTVKGQSATVASQLSSLSAQVGTLTSSDTVLAANVAALTSANQELATELLFYAAPLGTAPTTTPITVTGSLGLNAAKNYFVTASYGGKVFVANSKVGMVAAALSPLVGSSTVLAGTIVPGSDAMTVTSVNGNAIK